MPVLAAIRTALLLIALAGGEIRAAQAVPAVYRDEYLTITAGVAEVGLRPVHIGDAVSFVMQIEFDAERVRIETLDADFFERAFADRGVMTLYAPPVVTVQSRDDAAVLMRALWPFQILGCPREFANCPGEKIYELPVVSLAYQIIDETGSIVNEKSVRFRPWPGSIAMAPALTFSSGAGDEFPIHFPGGAHPEARAVSLDNGAGIFAIIAGMLLVAVGFNGALLKEQPRIHRAHTSSAGNRWQHALESLRNDAMSDEQWADLMRRCASWYCLDELDRNPHTRLDTDFDRFFAELLNQVSINQEQRKEYLGRFAELACETAASLASEEEA